MAAPKQPGLNAIQKYIDQEAKFDYDLDNWITDFEEGFLKFEKINPNFRPGYWGQDRENRPRIKELNEEGDAQQKAGYRVIEFFPDRDNKEESYVLFGTPLELMTQVTFFMNLSVMLKGLNIGAWLGYPVDEYLRAKPRTEITVQIILTTRKYPPFYGKVAQGYLQRQVTIPLADKTKLTFKALRDACGSVSGQNWGEWTARAYLSLDGDIKPVHQMVAGGNTEKKAIENLKKFLAFTKCKVKRISAHKINFDEGDLVDLPEETKKLYRNFQVYPAWVSVLNSKLVRLDDQRSDGKNTLSGKMLTKQNKLWLYMEKEPSYWQPNLQELLQQYEAKANKV